MSKNQTQTAVPKLRFPEFRDAEGWEVKPLGNVASFFKGKGLPKSEISPDASRPCIHYGELFTYYSEVVREIKGRTDMNAAAFYSLENDVLMPTSDVTPTGLAKASCIKMNDVILGGDILVIRTDRLQINGEFLSRLIRSRETEVLKLVTGSTVFHLYASSMEKLDLPFPKPEEQQKIADCLSSVDELIAHEGQKLEALQDHKKSLMQQLFPAEGETLPKRRFPEFKDAPEWNSLPLIKLAKFRRGSFPQPYGLPEWYDEEDGMPFVQVYDVGGNLLLKPKTKSKISKLAAKQSVFIPEGTVIITIQGSIGRVAITQYDAYIDRTLLLFEEFYRPIEKTFFAYVLQLLFEIERQKAPGGIIKTITKEVLSDFIVKIPPIEEQEKVAGCFLSIDNLINAQSQKTEALQEHKKGLMQQLFPSADEVMG